MPLLEQCHNCVISPLVLYAESYISKNGVITVTHHPSSVLLSKEVSCLCVSAVITRYQKGCRVYVCVSAVIKRYQKSCHIYIWVSAVIKKSVMSMSLSALLTRAVSWLCLCQRLYQEQCVASIYLSELLSRAVSCQ